MEIDSVRTLSRLHARSIPSPPRPICVTAAPVFSNGAVGIALPVISVIKSPLLFRDSKSVLQKAAPPLRPDHIP